MKIYEVTMLTKEEFNKYQELIPKLEGAYWLKDAPTNDGDHAGIVYNDDYADDSRNPNWAANIRPVIKYRAAQGEQALSPGSLIALAGKQWTILSEDTMICNEFVGKAAMMSQNDYDNGIGYNYETSPARGWLQNWAEENGIEQIRVSCVKLQEEFDRQMHKAYEYFSEKNALGEHKHAWSEKTEKFMSIMEEREKHGDIVTHIDEDGAITKTNRLSEATDAYRELVSYQRETPWEPGAKEFVSKIRALESMNEEKFNDMVHRESSAGTSYEQPVDVQFAIANKNPSLLTANLTANLQRLEGYDIEPRADGVVNVIPLKQPKDCAWKMELKVVDGRAIGRVAIDNQWANNKEWLKKEHSKIYSDVNKVMSAARGEKIINKEQGWIL